MRQRLLSYYRNSNLRLGGTAVIDQAVVGGTNFLMAVIVGQLCGSAELGLFALATTIWYLILSFLEATITSPFAVFVHRLDEDRRTMYAGSVIAHMIGLAIVATAILSLVTGLLYWLEYTKLSIALAALVVTMPIRMLRQFARRFHYATLNLNRALLLNISISVLQVLWLFVLYFFEQLTAATAILGVGCAYATVLSFWLPMHRKMFRISKERIIPDLIKNWALGRWIAASQIALGLAGLSLPWIIAFLLDEAQTGIFFSCMMLVNLSSPLLSAVQNILVPRSASSYAETGLIGLKQVTKKAVLILASGMGFFAAILVVFGELLVRFCFGEEFEGQQTVVALLGIKALIYSVSLGAASGLTILERSDLVFRSHIAGILVTLVLAFTLIGSYGPAGAAMAHLVGTIIGSVIVIHCYRRIVNEQKESGLSKMPMQVADPIPHSS